MTYLALSVSTFNVESERDVRLSSQEIAYVFPHLYSASTGISHFVLKKKEYLILKIESRYLGPTPRATGTFFLSPLCWNYGSNCWLSSNLKHRKPKLSIWPNINRWKWENTSMHFRWHPAVGHKAAKRNHFKVGQEKNVSVATLTDF